MNPCWNVEDERGSGEGEPETLDVRQHEVNPLTSIANQNNPTTGRLTRKRSARLDPDLDDWLTARGTGRGLGPSKALTDALEALRRIETREATRTAAKALTPQPRTPRETALDLVQSGPGAIRDAGTWERMRPTHRLELVEHHLRERGLAGGFAVRPTALRVVDAITSIHNARGLGGTSA